LNLNCLNEVISIKGLREPCVILDEVRKLLTRAMAQEQNKDGMDGVLLFIHKDGSKIDYAAAHNNPVLIRNGQVTEYPMDKMPIGKSDNPLPFNAYSIDIQKGDQLYLFSDGYADQFGGPFNKKYKHKRFVALLKTISYLSFSEQHDKLLIEFNAWKEGFEQTDDVLVVGLKF